MNTMFLHAHRGFAYLELLLVAFFLVALFLVMFGYSGKITSFLRKMSLFTMIIFHIQLIVGLGLLIFVSPLSTIIDHEGMGGLMKNADLRKLYVEHPFSMFLASMFITFANKKIKTVERLSMSAFWLAILGVVFFGFAFSIVLHKLFA